MILNADTAKRYGLIFDKNVKAYAYAAKQLNKYVKKCCNFSFEEFSQQLKSISIGYNHHSKALIDAADKTTLKRSGFRIVFKDGDIFIYGGSDVGAIYGVFEFCERFLGVRFLTSTDEVTPFSDNVEIREEDIECNPCFEQRECYHFSFIVNPDFALKRRFEGGNTPNHEEAGIINCKWYNKISNSHNSFSYVSKEKYYKTHPEMFTTPNPESKRDYKSETGEAGFFTECCYSNGITDDGKLDESLEVSTAKVTADSLYNFIKEDLTVKYFPFGKQDNTEATCYCPKCCAKRQRYGGDAGTMTIFLNAVIEAVEKRLEAEGITPNFCISTLAYQKTSQPPVDKDLKPIDGLVIPHERLHWRFAPHFKNLSYSIVDERQNEEDRKAFIGWSNLTKNLMIWEYPVPYMDRLYFAPSYLHMAEDVAAYHKAGASYVMYEEGCSCVQEYNIEMDSYILSKLFWNPNLNVYDLMKEYTDGYYGIAGKYVYEFCCKMLDFFKEKVAQKGGFSIIPVKVECEFMQPESYPLSLLTDCVDILQTGIGEVENSSLSLAEKLRYVKRLKKVLLSPLRMITRGKEYYFGDKVTEYEKTFYSIVEETGHLLQYTPVKIMEASISNYMILVDKEDSHAVECAEYLNDWFKNKTGVALEIVGCEEYYPTYGVKSISLGAQCFSKEFFKGLDFSKYNIFAKNRGWSVFLAGKDLKGACDVFVNNIKERTWFENHKPMYSLTYEFHEIVEYVKEKCHDD